MVGFSAASYGAIKAWMAGSAAAKQLDVSLASRSLTDSYIIDTDTAGDVDDAVNFAIVARAVRRGEAKVRGVVVSCTIDTSAPCVRGMLDAYGMTNVPVYAYQGATGTYNNTYTSTVRNRFGPYNALRTAFTDDLTGYRTMLAAALDGSVTILSNGGMTSLSRLLDSPADGISSLTGMQLVTAKVKRLVAMAGSYPTSSGSPEYNMSRDPAGSQNVANNWPTPIVFFGNEVGVSVYSGPSPDSDPQYDPVAYAFEVFGSVGGTLLAQRRNSWDQCASIYAFYGLSPWYTISTSGVVTVDGSGNSLWTANASGKHYYLSLATGVMPLADTVNAMLAEIDLTPQKPANRSKFLFQFSEGAGLRVYDAAKEDMSARIGYTTAGAPTWTAASSSYVLTFNGTSHAIVLPYRAGFNSQQIVLGALIKPSSISGVRQIIARQDWSTAGNAIFHFKLVSGKLTFCIYDSTGSGTDYTETGTSISAGTTYMVTAQINGTALTLRVNGVVVLTTTMARSLFVGRTSARVMIGARVNGSNVMGDYFVGDVAAVALTGNAVAADLTAMETALRSTATTKGWTIP